MTQKEKYLTRINWLLGGLALLLVVIVALLAWPRPEPAPASSGEKVEQIPNFVPEVEEIVTPPGEVPLRWFTYKDEERDISFRYPPEWTTPEKRLLGGEDTSADKGSPFNFPELNMIFDPLKSEGLRVTRIVSVKDLRSAGAAEDEAVDALLNIYEERAVTAGEGGVPIVPPRQDDLEAYSDPIYVQSEDESLRGIVFFANFITVQSQGPEKRLPYLVIQMTDGEQVVQFTHFIGRRDGEFLGTYKNRTLCSVDSCYVPEELESELDEIYELVIKSLSS